ncbi:hypothetical protein BT69DRAFT_1216975 [Atractiella rhizophila]|nr:hypothetical protein BT69DRAFT_1216975 [Atractiella rhizophila]
MDTDLRCNSLKCRKPLSLSGQAVVTTCSHIFCIDCANVLITEARLCPACETALTEQDDIVSTTLNPTNDYKTSVLSGLSPAIILDVANRAMNFWSYQMSQESTFQQILLKSSQERVAVLEKQCNNIVREANAEIALLKEKLLAAQKDAEGERNKVRDLKEIHKENSKEYTKLKVGPSLPQLRH